IPPVPKIRTAGPPLEAIQPDQNRHVGSLGDFDESAHEQLPVIDIVPKEVGHVETEPQFSVRRFSAGSDARLYLNEILGSYRSEVCRVPGGMPWPADVDNVIVGVKAGFSDREALDGCPYPLAAQSVGR